MEGIMSNLIALISASSAIIVTIINVISARKNNEQAEKRAQEAEKNAKEREERLIKEAKDEQQNMQIAIQGKALRNLLWDRLDMVCNFCIKEGKITRAQHKKIDAMYESYKALGGNGDMEFLKSKVEELPIAPEK